MLEGVSEESAQVARAVRFIEDNEICEWGREHGLSCGPGFELELPRGEAGARTLYAHGRRSGEEGNAARDLVAGLGNWDECLVSITLWGVWPSGEDWPEFYAWRGAHGERRSLEKAPGHLFEEGEASLLLELVGLVMGNAWDADVLCSRGGRVDGVRARISHDEWYALVDPSRDRE